MRGYGTRGQELVDQDLGAVARGGRDVRGSGSVGERVTIVAEEVAEVEGVGDWFRDGDRSRKYGGGGDCEMVVMGKN